MAQINETGQINDFGPSDDELRAALDLGQLESLEADLADAAAALEQIEQIRRSDLGPRERAAALDELVNDPRFALAGPPSDLSDLVGDRDLGAVEQVEAFAEA